MIAAIRKGLAKKYFRAVVWVLLLALFGLPSVISIFKRFSQPAVQSMARVNGYTIDTTTYKQKVAEEERRLQFFKQFGAQAEALLRSLGIQGNAQEIALQELVNDALLHTNAPYLHIAISTDYITKKIQDPSFLLQSLSSVIPPSLFNAAGVIDFRVLTQYLQRQGISMSQFENLVHDALIKETIFKLVQGAVYVPEPALKEAYAQEYSSKKFLLIPFSRAAALQTVKKNAPSDEQLKQFFTTQNAESRRYWVPEKRRLTLWTFEPAAYGIQVTDKEIKSYYAKNKESFKDTALAAATPRIKEILLLEKFKRIFNLDAQHTIAQSAHDATLFTAFVANKKGKVGHKIVENTESALARKAFMLPIAKKGYVIEEKTGVIFLVDVIDKAYLPEFSTIQSTVLRDYYEERAQELLEKQLQTLKERNEPVLKQEVTPWINPQKSESVDTLTKKGLPTARIMRMTHKGDFLDAFTADYAYAIRLEDIEPVNMADFQEKKETLRKNLFGYMTQLINKAFVASLRKNATIIIDKIV